MARRPTTASAISGSSPAATASTTTSANWAVAVHHGQTAAIGFWQNSSGQALLKSLNNGSSDTNLGIWLAANFPNLYGQNAGAASLLGKTNAQIASFYTTLYKTTAQKLDAQVLALAFATYVTDAQLAGTVARNYGFEVTDAGVGSATYNVGSNGAAFGVANNSTVAVSQLLQIADNKSWNGTLWDADHSGTLSATETAGATWRTRSLTRLIMRAGCRALSPASPPATARSRVPEVVGLVGAAGGELLDRGGQVERFVDPA